jgi:hypothetical protein
MKGVIAIVIAAVLIAAPVSADPPKTWAYVGVEYDSDVGVKSTFGVSTKLSGNLYILPRTSIGRYGHVDSDLGYFFSIDERLAFGLVAGPGVSWEDPPEEDLFVLVNGAVGGIIHYHWPIDLFTRMGVAVGAKYKFSIDNEYCDGWHGGVFLTYQF